MGSCRHGYRVPLTLTGIAMAGDIPVCGSCDKCRFKGARGSGGVLECHFLLLLLRRTALVGKFGMMFLESEEGDNDIHLYGGKQRCMQPCFDGTRMY